MLFDAGITHEIAATLNEHYGATRPPLVVDPVCVSTSGHTLLQPEAVATLVSELFPLASVITPNKSEAELLLAHCGSPSKLERMEDMLPAAKKLLATGCKAVLLKGGHITATMDEVKGISAAHPEVIVVCEGLLGDNMEILQTPGEDASRNGLVIDVLQEADSTTLFVRPRVESKSTHGTGCTLSSALACALAQGKSRQCSGHMHNAVLTIAQSQRLRDQQRFIRTLVSKRPNLSGTATARSTICIPSSYVVCHSMSRLSCATSGIFDAWLRPTSSVPYPLTRVLIESSRETWQAYVQHDFVKELAQGTLRKECFLHFIK